MNRFLLLSASLTVSVAAMANWGSTIQDPVKVFPSGTNSYATEVKAGADGSVWAVIYHPNADNADGEEDIKNVIYEYRLQHFDAQGNPQFADNGILLCDYSNISYTVVNTYLAVDKDGNAVVSVKDCRNSNGKQHSYTAYKVNAKGEMLWGEDGVAISDATKPADFAAFMSMTELDDSSFVFAWMEQTSTGDTHVYLQRLSHDGKAMWDSAKVSILDEYSAYPYLVSSGDNTCILLYARTSSAILYARKLDFEGESVWGKDTRIYRGGFGQTPIQTLLGLTESGDGGALVTWTDDRSGTNIESAYMSYVDADGKLGFAGASDEGDVKLCYDGWRCFNVSAVPAADGSAFYAVWRRTDNDQRFQGIMMQKVSKNGELLWDDNAKELLPTAVSSLGYVSLQQAGTDGACAFFEEYRSYFDQQCYASRFDKDGKYVWEGQIIPLSEPNRLASSLKSQPYTGGAWLFNWTDGGTSAEDKETTYYMSVLKADGTIGTASAGVALTTTGEAGLSYNGRALCGAEGVTARVYTSTGALAATCRLTACGTPLSLPAGIYIAHADGHSIKFAVK